MSEAPPVDIKDLRRRLGGEGGPISQKRLAEDHLGCDQSTVHRMETDPSKQRGPVAMLLRKLDAETREPATANKVA